jgi:clan AA aspartic protease (TIGR02281 family)
LLGLTLVALAAPASGQTVTLRAQGHGMFYADVLLNGRIKVRALIDTGASAGLSMCGSTAAALGLRLGESVNLATANGVITARRATVRSLRIGGIEVRDVTAVVDERSQCDKGVLVGLSVLRKLNLRLYGEILSLSTSPAGPGSVEWWLLGGLWSGLLVSLLLARRPRLRVSLTRSWQREQAASATPFGARSFFE